MIDKKMNVKYDKENAHQLLSSPFSLSKNPSMTNGHGVEPTKKCWNVKKN